MARGVEPPKRGLPPEPPRIPRDLSLWGAHHLELAAWVDEYGWPAYKAAVTLRHQREHRARAEARVR